RSRGLDVAVAQGVKVCRRKSSLRWASPQHQASGDRRCLRIEGLKTARLGAPAGGWERFAAVRIRPASRDWKLSTPHPLEWLLIEWPEGEKEPTKYWLSTLPEDTPLGILVDTAKMRWRIERDYEELKSELGVAHFEGRSWRGFHHHATLCIAAYGFLIRERAAIPPSGPRRRQISRLSSRPRPRGAANPTRTAYRKFNRDDPKTTHGRVGANPHALPLLPSVATKTTLSRIIVTQ